MTPSLTFRTPRLLVHRLDHAAQGLAGEEVEVEVGHLLERVGAVVGEDKDTL